MEKLVPIKSCVLISGKNSAGEEFHQAKITLSLWTGVTGVISVSVSRAGALPASWRLESGIKPVVSCVKHERYDEALRAFVTCDEQNAHRTERLVALGFVGVVDADLAKFSVVKTEIAKNGGKVCHLRRTADGNLSIRRLPYEVEEAGICLL